MRIHLALRRHCADLALCRHCLAKAFYDTHIIHHFYTQARGGRFKTPAEVSAHLQSLASESKKQVEKFGQLTSGVGHAHTQLSQAQLKG